MVSGEGEGVGGDGRGRKGGVEGVRDEVGMLLLVGTLMPMWLVGLLACLPIHIHGLCLALPMSRFQPN